MQFVLNKINHLLLKRFPVKSNLHIHVTNGYHCRHSASLLFHTYIKIVHHSYITVILLQKNIMQE